MRLKYDELLSSFAFNFNLRCHNGVGRALMDTLAEALGAGFTPELRLAWTEAYGFVASTMLQGTAEAAAEEAALSANSDANSQLQDLRSALGEERQVTASQLVYE